MSNTVVTSADLQVTKTGPATAVAGTQVTYTLSVTNAGPSDAQGVTLSDTLPANPPGSFFIRIGGSPQMAVDTTSGGQFSGAVYLAWMDRV